MQQQKPWDHVLEHWFGDLQEPNHFPLDKSKLWFTKSMLTDRELRERFGALRLRAIAGDLPEWESTPQGLLALIVLIDQFSRNIFRETPEMYSHDGISLGWCLRGRENGMEKRLLPMERIFFNLPLEHAEDLSHQERYVAFTGDLLAEPLPGLAEFLARANQSALRHREIVQRFGRFPHRNQILGRKSSAEELEFLTQPGSSF